MTKKNLSGNNQNKRLENQRLQQNYFFVVKKLGRYSNIKNYFYHKVAYLTQLAYFMSVKLTFFEADILFSRLMQLNHFKLERFSLRL